MYNNPSTGSLWIVSTYGYISYCTIPHVKSWHNPSSKERVGNQEPQRRPFSVVVPRWHLGTRSLALALMARNVLYRELIEALRNNTPMSGLLGLQTVHPDIGQAVSRATKMVSRKVAKLVIQGLPVRVFERPPTSTPSTLTTQVRTAPFSPLTPKFFGRL